MRCKKCTQKRGLSEAEYVLNCARLFVVTFRARAQLTCPAMSHSCSLTGRPSTTTITGDTERTLNVRLQTFVTVKEQKEYGLCCRRFSVRVKPVRNVPRDRLPVKLSNAVGTYSVG